MRRGSIAVPFLLVLAAPVFAVIQVTAAPACQTSLPANVAAGLLEPDLVALLQRSATFRRQCERLAAVGVLRVTIDMTRALAASARAETVINRHEAGALRAAITLRPTDDYIELIAHEFEHILEQVEGVNLRAEVLAHRAWLTEDGAYETRRASEAGLRVRRESDDSAAEPVQADRRKPPAGRHPFE